MITLPHTLRPTHQHRTWLRKQHAATLREAAALIANQCSLRTEDPHFSPPTLELPTDPVLTLEVSRQRISPELTARLRAWDPAGTLLHPPAFVLTFRILGAAGRRELARTWVYALMPDDQTDTIFERFDAPSPTFQAVLDARFHPLPCPPDLFTQRMAA